MHSTTQVLSIFDLQAVYEDVVGKETKINAGIYLVEVFVVSAMVPKQEETNEDVVVVLNVVVSELGVVIVGVAPSKEKGSPESVEES